MPTAASRSVNQKLDYIIPFVLALLVTGFLFFIDEGYYDMRWAEDPGNWFVFFVYSGIMLGGQLLIQQFMFKKYTGWRRHAVVAFVGIPLGVLTALGFFLVWMAI
jgi:hypothetical protein